MDLDEILKARGTNLQDLQKKQAELKVELDNRPFSRGFRIRELKQQLYRIQDFFYANTQGKVELRKDNLKQFFWDPFKEDREGIRLTPWQKTGGWVYDGLYLGCSFYALWMTLHNRFTTPIYLMDNGKTHHLFSRRKDSPLELKEQALDTKLAQEVLFPLNEGDICTSRGIVLFGDNKDYATELFTKVMQGIEILPKPKGEKSYTQKNKKGGEGKIIEPRTVGQIYLQGLNPSNVTQGQVFGSEFSYLAFYYGDKVVVEGNETGRATYLFTRTEFDNLRHNSRSQILELQPVGFNGRVIHCNNGIEEWKRAIQEYLA